MADSTINSSIDACAPTGEAPGLGGGKGCVDIFSVYPVSKCMEGDCPQNI